MMKPKTTERETRGVTIAMGLAALLLAGVSLAPLGAQAQTVMPNLPGSTANSADRPSPKTPVPPQFQESYKAYLKMKAAAHGGTIYTRADYAKMPDWSGVWTREGSAGLKFDPKQAGNGIDRPLGPTTAVLTPRYKEAFEEKLRQVALGNEWDQLSDCLPAGYPRWLTEPFLREFIVTPQETWWSTEQQSETRRFFTDGRGHIPDDVAQSLWDGDSIGFWDGQTLVVHTIRVTHGQYQRSQPDYSTQTSTVERIRMVDHNTIEDDVTVWDPMGLAKPWHVVEKYVRVTAPGARIDMWSCDSNNNVIRTPIGASQFILPGETVTVQRTYKNPDTFYLTDAQKKLFSEDEKQEGAK
jgi:hypothetical protein